MPGDERAPTTLGLAATEVASSGVYAPELAAGTLLGGRYRIQRFIGRGGMGSVYEALQEDLGRRVALKTMHREVMPTPALAERFKREAHAAAALGHANIVQITEFRAAAPEVGGEPAFIVMEYLEGASLATVIEREGPLAGERVAFIAEQVLDALAAAHRAHIVHRDIKPDNIFLTEVGRVKDLVKLLDFGIAKRDKPGDDALTSTGVLIGTPAYMAPEQVRGRSVDHRADLYAVGACMYHALTGKMPFSAASVNALLFAIAEDSPSPLRGERPDLPGKLVAVIERAMRKDCEARFATAEAMRAALTAGTDSAYARTSPPPARRERRALFVAGGVVALAVAGAVIATTRGGREVASAGREPPSLAAAPSATSEEPVASAAAPPVVSIATSASSASSATASEATPIAAPKQSAPSAPPPRRKATGGRGVMLSGLSCTDVCDSVTRAREDLVLHQGELNACYASAQYDPMDHVNLGWILQVARDGSVTGISSSGGAGPPKLEACVRAVLRKVLFRSIIAAGPIQVIAFSPLPE